MARIFHKAGAREYGPVVSGGCEEAAHGYYYRLSAPSRPSQQRPSERASARTVRSRNNKQFVLGKAYCVHSRLMYRVSSMSVDTDARAI